MDKKSNYETLRNLALGEGMALFGVADISPAKKDFILPAGAADTLGSGISLGFRLSRAVLNTVEKEPNQIYYFHYQRVNILLDQTALKLTALIQERGFNALPIPASQVIDWQRQLGSVSHREIARLAGHGWYGKNNLLVNKRFGSGVRYVTVLTDMPLETDKPADDNCGECGACLAFCPAGAIKEGSFDREACHIKLKEFSKIQGIGQMVCGVCLKACPGKLK